jgi:hypothetical protein
MKRLFGALLLCGFLTASMVQAKPATPKVHQSKAQKSHVKKVKKQNAKARKAAKARSKTHSA